VLFVLSIFFPQHLTEEWYNPLASVVRFVEAIKASRGVCGGERKVLYNREIVCISQSNLHSPNPQTELNAWFLS